MSPSRDSNVQAIHSHPKQSPASDHQERRRVDDQLRCACGTYADGRINYLGDAACSLWPDCVLD